MNIEVLSFKPYEGAVNRGMVSLICNGLELNLRVRQFKEEKLYIEMPRFKVGNGAFIYPIRIHCKEESKQFQKDVLAQIEAKWPGTLEIKKFVDKNI